MLDDVRELVGDEGIAGESTGAKLAGAERDVLADRKRPRVEAVRQPGAGRVGVELDVAEPRAERGLHPAAYVGWQVLSFAQMIANRDLLISPRPAGSGLEEHAAERGQHRAAGHEPAREIVGYTADLTGARPRSGAAMHASGDERNVVPCARGAPGLGRVAVQRSLDLRRAAPGVVAEPVIDPGTALRALSGAAESVVDGRADLDAQRGQELGLAHAAGSDGFAFVLYKQRRSSLRLRGGFGRLRCGGCRRWRSCLGDAAAALLRRAPDGVGAAAGGGPAESSRTGLSLAHGLRDAIGLALERIVGRSDALDQAGGR